MQNRLLKYLFLVLLCLPGLATAELKPFSSGSLKEITAQRDGKPFLLVLWSMDCPPCLKELEHIGRLRAQFPNQGLVLVSTDGPEYATEVEGLLARHGLTDSENWYFADNFPERLRYHIDPNPSLTWQI